MVKTKNKAVTKCRIVLNINAEENSVTVFRYEHGFVKGEYFVLCRPNDKRNEGVYRIDRIKGKKLFLDPSYNVLIADQAVCETSKKKCTYVDKPDYRPIPKDSKELYKIKEFVSYYSKAMMAYFGVSYRVAQFVESFRLIKDWKYFYETFHVIKELKVEQAELYIQGVFREFIEAKSASRKPYPSVLVNLKHLYIKSLKKDKKDKKKSALKDLNQAILIDLGRDLIELFRLKVEGDFTVPEHEIILRNSFRFSKYTFLTHPLILQFIETEGIEVVGTICPRQKDQVKDLYYHLQGDKAHLQYLMDARKHINEHITKSYETAKRDYPLVHSMEIIKFVSNELEKKNFKV